MHKYHHLKLVYPVRNSYDNSSWDNHASWAFACHWLANDRLVVIKSLHFTLHAILTAFSKTYNSAAC